ncbi:3-deoxy-manno-octulosonate cytidylyltransferase [Acidipila sp. EB88]|nr:3-deoxy-manno-octulosonate cytidylyltransferase [Acidipila sp. EB88]
MNSPAHPPRVLGVIPARLASTRLPRKMLLDIAGEPMLAWVYRAARACTVLDSVLIATDSAEIMALAQRYGFPAVFTPEDCASGTDRVRAVAQAIPSDIYVNIQGDEPLLRPEHLQALLEPMLTPREDGQVVEVSTLATPCPPEQFDSPSAVKVVCARDGRALYFSRSPVPYDRDGLGQGVPPLKHLGLYAFRRDMLERFTTLPPSRLEATEKLEQLRLLEHGIDIWVAQTPFDSRGVDTEEDRQAVEAILYAKAAAAAGVAQP